MNTGIFIIIRSITFNLQFALNGVSFLFLPKIWEVRKCIVALCLMMQAAVFAQEWNTDLETVKRKAATENKKILLFFTGSDWCKPCMHLDENILSSNEFKAAANMYWVLLRADFPQKGGNPEPVNVNDIKMILAEKYNRDGFFPYIVLLDKNGKVLGKTGYEKFNTVQEYIEYFKKLGK